MDFADQSTRSGDKGQMGRKWGIDRKEKRKKQAGNQKSRSVELRTKSVLYMISRILASELSSLYLRGLRATGNFIHSGQKSWKKVSSIRIW